MKNSLIHIHDLNFYNPYQYKSVGIVYFSIGICRVAAYNIVKW